MRLQSILLIMVVLFFSAGGFLFSQENEEEIPYTPLYELGDQLFSISAGMMIPLFFHDPNDGISETNLSVGGMGALEWGAFLNNNLTVGIRLEGMFSISPLNRVLGMIPLTAKMNYFFRAYPFEFPLFLNAGINFLTTEEYLYIGPIVKAGFGGYWSFHPEWSLGIQVGYWWVPETYAQSHELAADSRFGNFLEISLSALYHFSD